MKEQQLKMTSKEKIDKAWELVNSKYIETNDEIQLVRFAVRMARELIEKAQKQEKLLKLYKEYFEYSEMLKDGRKFGGRMLVEHERDKIIEEIKELEK